MTRRWGAAFCLAAAVLAACSSDDDDSVAARATTTKPPATETTEPVATTIPATTTTTVPPPYSFDNSVPAPTLVNTGTDYDAIYRSLDRYGEWLLAHNPDIQLIDEIVVDGTKLYDTYESDISGLSRINLRLYDTATMIETLEVASAQPALVSLRATYSQEDKVLIDPTGKEIDRAALPSPRVVTILLTANANGRWRLASVAFVTEPEVQL